MLRTTVVMYEAQNNLGVQVGQTGRIGELTERRSKSEVCSRSKVARWSRNREAGCGIIQRGRAEENGTTQHESGTR